MEMKKNLLMKKRMNVWLRRWKKKRKEKKRTKSSETSDLQMCSAKLKM